jgi:lipopolysaccharide transport system permease protein
LSLSEGVTSVGRRQAAPALPAEVWVIEPHGTSVVARLRELWRYRRLLPYFAGKTLRWTYRSTLLGWLWLIIRPLFPVLTATLVFHQVAGIGTGDVPYFLFFMTGSAVWHLFEESLIWITRSFQINRRILTKLYFPRLLLPAAGVSPALSEFSLYLLLIVLAGVYFLLSDGRLYLVLGPGLLLSALAVVLTLIFGISIGLFTSVLGAEHRDIRWTLHYVTRFWFFLTPIAYPLSLVPEKWRWLAAINPMTTVVELFRSGLLGIPVELTLVQLGTTVLIMGVTLVLGLRFFIMAEAASIDQL